MTPKSKRMLCAKIIKNDEFYTQYEDIVKECSNYIGHFFNKVIYCNCDTEESNFVKYFKTLKQLGLIKDVLYTGGLGGLDFRSPESIELLKQADIVISNPPFSLFRDYVDQLIKYNKKFLIIGNRSAVAYRGIFELIKKNELWIGTRVFGTSMLFDVPDPEELLSGKKGSAYAIKNGVIKARIPSAWFTNLNHSSRPKEFPLVKTYFGNECEYPKYDNFDAINVNCKKDIPRDYIGIMGVPVTFVDIYNPEQFKILGLDKDFTYDHKGVKINGKQLFTRIFIQRNRIKPCIPNDDNPIINTPFIRGVLVSLG